MFSKAFWVAAGEKALVTFATSFAASDFFQKGFTVRGLEVSVSAAALAALYQFVNNLGAVKTAKAHK